MMKLRHGLFQCLTKGGFVRIQLGFVRLAFELIWSL